MHEKRGTPPSPWRQDLPAGSIAETFRRIVDHELRHLPEHDQTAERRVDGEGVSLSVRLLADAGGTVTMTLPLSPDTVRGGIVGAPLEFKPGSWERQLSTAVNGALLLSTTLPPESHAVIDAHSRRVTVRGEAWEAIDGALCGIGSPPRSIIERDGATHAHTRLPEEDIDLIKLARLLRERGGFRERGHAFIESLSDHPDYDAEMAAHALNYRREVLSGELRGILNPTFQRLDAASTTFALLPGESFRDLERGEYAAAPGMTGVLEAVLPDDAIFLVAWNEATHDVRAEMIDVKLLDFASAERVSARLVPELASLTPLERMSQRVTIFLGPSTLDAPLPDQFRTDAGANDRLANFAPDLAPDTSTREGRHEAIRRTVIRELTSRAGIDPVRCVVHAESAPASAIVFFNGATGGFAVESTSADHT